MHSDRVTYYSASVDKLNRSLKTDRRILVVNNRKLFRMDESFQMKTKRPVEFSNITGVSLSSGSDGGIVDHIV